MSYLELTTSTEKAAVDFFCQNQSLFYDTLFIHKTIHTMQTDEQLKEIVRQKYSEIALQDKADN